MLTTTEDFHPELPGPEDTIVDFPEGKVGAPKDGMPPADSYSALDVTTLNTRRTPVQKQPELLLCLCPESCQGYRTRPRAAYKVPLLTAMANRVIDMEDTTGASRSSGTPSTVEKSPLDFADEDLPSPNTEGVGKEEQIQDEVSHGVPPLENPSTTEVVLESDLEQEVAAIGPLAHKRRHKREYHWREIPSNNGKAASSTITPAAQDTPTDASSVKDLDPLSYAEPRPIPEQDIAQSSKKTIVAEDPDSERSTSFTSMGGSPENKNIEALLEAKADMKKAAEAKNAELMKELEGLRGYFSDLQLSNQQLSQQVSTLQAQITSEEKIKAAFEEFKKYEDFRVEQCCAEIDARLDKLRVDFDEELFPHMLTAIAGRRWVIGHGLRLAVMKCGETPELRQAFANVVSAGLVKGMSEGLEHDKEHGKAGRDLEAMEAYDPKAHNKYLKALQELKDLKYSLVDQLEGLKDAPMELIMASLHLESNSKEDAPQWIRDLRPSISQLKIQVYPEKKKKCQVVCRTHRVSSAHHARSDGVPESAPIVSLQGLVILLADASTQTEISEGEASLRLLRSMSLPAMYNLDWP
ncbi:hypothetical protein Tco_0027333 [Tanacetum coccineum]